MKKYVLLGVIALIFLLAVPAVMATDESTTVVSTVNTMTTVVACTDTITFPAMDIDGAQQEITGSCTVATSSTPWKLTASDLNTGLGSGQMYGAVTDHYLITPLKIFDYTSYPPGSGPHTLPHQICAVDGTGPNAGSCTIDLFQKAVNGDPADSYAMTMAIDFAVII
jgi:hypothetical protein